MSASDALDIPVNRLPGTDGPGKLLFFRNEVQSFKVGSMKFTIVGPTDQELTDLKTGWVNWLQTMKQDVRRIRASCAVASRSSATASAETRRSTCATGTASPTSRV